MEHIHNNAFRDVRNYPEKFLKIIGDKLCLPVTYKKSWDDGFAARGWKLDASIGDPQIIASTRETGENINTSVFVHDILDHFLSGFGVSGHRSEAMALMQLSKRTGSDPRPDYEQNIREDILNGYVNGEPFAEFLPDQITELLPSDTKMSDKEISAFLKQNITANYLNDILVQHFFTLGKAGENHAIASRRKLGLVPDKQTETGLTLQKLLEHIDSEVKQADIDSLEGFISIDNSHVIFTAKGSSQLVLSEPYQIVIRS
ncbi:MAG: hypothetical protein PF589_05035 [Gammaproteobacteria bacterium]|jgi:hypothetical protein|nr:hypothetical protein [Gammaproteobacteria bacterium]